MITFRLPPKMVISIAENSEAFLQETKLTYSNQIYVEVVRQIFDYIDNSFYNFSNNLNFLPKIEMLVGFDEHCKRNGLTHTDFSNSVKSFGVGIYLECIKSGLFYQEAFPYILENVSNDLCLLYFDGRIY